LRRAIFFVSLFMLVSCQAHDDVAAEPEVRGNPQIKEVAVSPVAGMTADDLIAKYVAARGGKDKLAAVKSVRMTGTFSGGDLNAPLVVEKKRPNLYRWHLRDGKDDDIKAYDGETTWQLAVQRDIPKPTKMPPAEARTTKLLADFDAPLVDYKAKGEKVTLLGQEIAGAKAYKLRVTFKDGSTGDYFLDPKTFLLIRSTGLTPGPQGRPRPSETEYSDYKEAGGVLWPGVEKIQLINLPFHQTTRWDKVEVNVNLPDSSFKMPS
jgi:outer membrane lipoprotein-sorting protein